MEQLNQHRTKPEQYFATLSEDDIGSELMLRHDVYYDYIQNAGLLSLWRQSYSTYYSGTRHLGALGESGEQGEFTTISVNHYHSLLKHKVALTVKTRPSFEPRAANSDYKSQAQTILARGLLDYYMREKHLERILKRAVSFAVRYGEGFVRAEWDAGIGGVVQDDESPEEIREGDIVYEAFAPIDIIRDVSKDSSDRNDWYIVRSFKNKFDLIAKYCSVDDIDDFEEDDDWDDETREQAISDYDEAMEDNDSYKYEMSKLKDSLLHAETKDTASRDGRKTSDKQSMTDDIPVYEFYHAKTPSVPEGRYVLYTDEETILMDNPLPYDVVPVYDIMGGEIDGSPFGYSIAFNLLPLQEAVDGLSSSILTNQKTFAVQLIGLPKGSGIKDSQISEGLTIIEYTPINARNGGLPEAINLTSTPVEVFNYLDKLERTMETLSGINSVTRGNPEASLKSGAALALVQSMAIEFSVGLQQSYVNLLENVGTATINILKQYANTERVARIVGKSNRSMMKSFKGDDLNEINNVTVDVGSPLARTTAGKMEILEAMKAIPGVITTAEQVLQVIQTGQLEPAIEGTTAELMLIRGENEALGEGDNMLRAIATDNHAMHIKEHKSVVASPEARVDVAVVEATMQHIQAHINLLQETDPSLLMILGQEPLPPSPAPQPGAPQGQIPMGAEMPIGTMNPQDPLTVAAGNVNQPGMPNNPLTGEDYNPIDGGLGPMAGTV